MLCMPHCHIVSAAVSKHQTQSQLHPSAAPNVSTLRHLSTSKAPETLHQSLQRHMLCIFPARKLLPQSIFPSFRTTQRCAVSTPACAGCCCCSHTNNPRDNSPKTDANPGPLAASLQHHCLPAATAAAQANSRQRVKHSSLIAPLPPMAITAPAAIPAAAAQSAHAMQCSVLQSLILPSPPAPAIQNQAPPDTQHLQLITDTHPACVHSFTGSACSCCCRNGSAASQSLPGQLPSAGQGGLTQPAPQGWTGCSRTCRGDAAAATAAAAGTGAAAAAGGSAVMRQSSSSRRVSCSSTEYAHAAGVRGDCPESCKVRRFDVTRTHHCNTCYIAHSKLNNRCYYASCTHVSSSPAAMSRAAQMTTWRLTVPTIQLLASQLGLQRRDTNKQRQQQQQQQQQQQLRYTSRTAISQCMQPGVRTHAFNQLSTHICAGACAEAHVRLHQD
jgi:hypothetical protein